MPDRLTTITELVTGIGMLGYDDVGEAVQARPTQMVSVAPALWDDLERWRSGTQWLQAYEAAFANGRAFLRAQDALRGRIPALIDWRGNSKPVDDELVPADLRVDVYRSSGPGGQGVNTTDSAVRLTHLPTGIVVSCQNERSQLQNKASAMAVLQSKLLERRRQEEQAKIDALKGDSTGSWGNQMRSYVLHPYQMVKDLRTEHETGNVDAVLDGDLDAFMEAFLRRERGAPPATSPH